MDVFNKKRFFRLRETTSNEEREREMFAVKKDEPNAYKVLGFADPNNSATWDTPGLGELSKDPSAADEQIKAAYRTLSRKVHPDKNRDVEAGVDTTKQAQELNDAYEKIKNEEARKKYGASRKIAQRFDREAKDISPTCGSWVFTMLLIAIFTLMPLLVALRLDGTIDASWPVVLIPFWIFDFYILWILGYVSSNRYGSVGMSSCLTLLMLILIFASILSFQIMICVDEENPFIKDNYLIIVLPVILASCSLCVVFTSCCFEHAASVLSLGSFIWYDSPGIWFRVVVWTQCMIAQSVLIALKLNKVSDYGNRDWTYIFIPSYVMIGLSCMLFMTSWAFTIIVARENVLLEKIRMTEHLKRGFFKMEEDDVSTPFLKQKRKKAMGYVERWSARMSLSLSLSLSFSHTNQLTYHHHHHHHQVHTRTIRGTQDGIGWKVCLGFCRVLLLARFYSTFYDCYLQSTK